MSAAIATVNTTLAEAGTVVVRATESTAVGPTYQASDIATRQGIVDLKSDWQRLEKLSKGSAVFQAFDLCLPWLDNYVFVDAPTHRAHVLTFHDEHGRMVALAPLAQKISGRIQLAQWIGDPLIQYGDILMDPHCDHQALRDAFAHVLSTWNIHGLHLRNVREDARVHKIMDVQAHQIGEGRVAGIADLSAFASVDDYFNTFSKTSKKTRKAKRRKLSEQGELSHHMVKAGPRAVALCQLALDWKVAWLAERGLSSRTFMDARALEVLKQACGRADDTNPMTLFVQNLDDKPIAIEIGLLGPEGNAAFMGSYDPAYESFSAGSVQIESTVLFAHEQGWAAYDMLAPMSEYKQGLATRTLGVADYMKPLGIVGLAYRHGYLGFARPTVKTLWGYLPAGLRSFMLRITGRLAKS